MKTCVDCGKELPTPLEEFGDIGEERCQSCFLTFQWEGVTRVPEADIKGKISELEDEINSIDNQIDELEDEKRILKSDLAENQKLLQQYKDERSQKFKYMANQWSKTGAELCQIS